MLFHVLNNGKKITRLPNRFRGFIPDYCFQLTANTASILRITYETFLQAHSSNIWWKILNISEKCWCFVGFWTTSKPFLSLFDHVDSAKNGLNCHCVFLRQIFFLVDRYYVTWRFFIFCFSRDTLTRF